jgi:hypothetical protein
LSGLTFVSLGARTQLPWLYDNFFTIVRWPKLYLCVKLLKKVTL